MERFEIMLVLFKIIWLRMVVFFHMSTPATVPQQPPAPPTPPAAPVYLWDTHDDARHSVRLICDEEGLPLTPTVLIDGKLYLEKDVVCACIEQESHFLTNPKPNQNKDPKTGAVWSTDYGIVQVNDHFHIGPGKDFPSVEYVIANPEACVRWMVRIMKATGKLQPWSSYTTGAFKKYLP